MKIKLPGIRFIAPKTYNDVSEQLVTQYLKIAFWISPFAIWKIIDLIKPLLEKLQ